MFFPTIARLRALTVLFTTSFLFSSSAAQQDRLFTSSVTYCQPPESLLIQQFDVTYFARNKSVSFNIAASSVLPDVAVSANLLFNVYGMKPVNLTLDLCKVLSGALCKLPIHEFVGQDSLTIPDSFSSKIPDIAYKIPDLEAYAQFMLTETDSGRIRACVQATLSNGWSTHQPAVEWSTGGVAIATLIGAIWQSQSPYTPLPVRLIDLLSLYQTITVTAFLNLNYPSLYRSFTLNFGWAMSLFTSSPPTVQDAIDNMRARTGGKLANSTQTSPVGLVNRKLSPFNENIALTPEPSIFIQVPNTFLSAFSIKKSTHSYLLSDVRLQQLATTGDAPSGTVQVVTQDSSNVLQAGVPLYVNSLHIATANAFMTVFICSLILILIATLLFVVGYGVMYTIERFNLGHRDSKLELDSVYPSFVRAWSLRLALMMFTPLMVFSMYQWTLRDSWLSVLLSVITFLAITVGLFYTYLAIFRRRRSTDIEGLHNTSTFLLSHGPVLAPYRIQRYYFSLFYVASAFLKALFIAAVRSQGLAQVVLLLLVEIGTLLGFLVLRPHKTRGGDILTTFLAVVRVICTGLLFAFVESFGVQAIPRVAIGVVIVAIFSISVIVMVFNILLNLGLQKLWRRGKKEEHSPSSTRQDSADNILEKGACTPTPSDAANSLMSRARNPTPDRNIPLDPSVIQPYPTTPSTATSPTDCASNPRDSASTNLGTILPRRWSITPLHSPTSSSDDHPPCTTTHQAVNALSRTSEESSYPPSSRLR
ncbi:hypothetical protein E1B28_000790 [Marasmius oreades]|uniref:ML-like domain-containing protein n=1 Tax=Marasmius oreades TaxID=181124 RepID=A0A9P7V226_9AGAR|nr:uncharacterized protein E1B28_000790 [Marasmius oreades]KAG7098890.1 hypothetical protein E1B28_000790 [Marasmius oreades]